MKSQPNRDYVSNDDIQTPLALTHLIVEHFQPHGLALEPCEGDGNFYRALLHYPAVKAVYSCEINQGRDFMDYAGPHVDYIATNPPWSKIRDFMRKSFEVADNVIFLMTVNHCLTSHRYDMARKAGFGLKEVLLVDWPDNFPKSGFLLGAVHWQRGWDGPLTLTDRRQNGY